MDKNKKNQIQQKAAKLVKGIAKNLKSIIHFEVIFNTAPADGRYLKEITLFVEHCHEHYEITLTETGGYCGGVDDVKYQLSTIRTPEDKFFRYYVEIDKKDYSKIEEYCDKLGRKMLAEEVEDSEHVLDSLLLDI